MKALFSLVSFSLFVVTGFSQKIIATPVGSPEVLYNENGVTISAQMTECNNVERNEIMTYKILTLTNSNAAPASIKMRQDSYYNDKCYTCENEEYTHTFNLEANEAKAGTCYGDTNPLLAVFYSMKDGYIKEVLSDFKINVVRLF
jgi:hypothetical protein